ncbi:MOSC containing domain protein [Collimonas arenae]|uniref:MOSC containing domain protein n=1 Tax=Collimonas arenae TaxID=279058 RepID=A0A127PWF5_9BURK|nr:MOSC domain-containing protein [Collimonas arenae]AMP02133.1 MOSC containing domain protein [Collimonas arenae]AMP12029.1 MOSC containing domain protein [Collimonas arenae]
MLTASYNQDIGTVRDVKIRRLRSVEPQSLPQVNAISGIGLEGDMHADPLSPRQVLLASTSAYESFDLNPNSLRENLLLDADVSRLKSGGVLCIGSSVALWLMFQCEACGHLNVQKADLSKVIGNQRGMLSRVLRGGEIRPGDRVRYFELLMPSWSLDWRDRIRMILSSMPSGQVVEYKQLARIAGVPSGYCRVFPRVLKEMGTGYSSKAVSVRSQSTRPRWLGSELFNVSTNFIDGVSEIRSTPHHVTPHLENKMQKEDNTYAQVKHQMTKSLSDSGRTEDALNFGAVNVLLTKGRSLKNDTAQNFNPKPYPEVSDALPSDYDSWLS